MSKKLSQRACHTYGKYGNLARVYLEEHKTAKMWCLAGQLHEYLHNIDKQADKLYEVMYNKLTSLPQYKKSEDFMKNLAIETEIQKRIEEEILNEIVYVD